MHAQGIVHGLHHIARIYSSRFLHGEVVMLTMNTILAHILLTEVEVCTTATVMVDKVAGDQACML